LFTRTIVIRGDRRHIVRQSGRRQTANRPLRSSDHVPFHQGQKENRQGHTTLPAQDKSHNLIADLRKIKERLKYPASQYLEPFQFVKISHFNNFKFLERLHKAQVFKFHISIISSSSSTSSKFAIFSIIESMLN
jgi:hypothetical protein